MTYEEVKATIQKKGFETLIDCEEGQCIEVKEARGYDLSQPGGKYEFAKDVTAFANSSGGFIVIGMTHKRLEHKKCDVIAGFDYIAENQIDTTLVRQIFSRHVYPKIQDAEVKWHQHGSNTDEGVFVVHIPPQDDAQKPYLITRVIEEGKQVQGYLLGIVERDGDNNVPLAAGQLHKILRRGRSEKIDRLIAIEAKIDQIAEHASAATPRAIDLLEGRMEDGEEGE